ncbi:MAG: hypothetical protein QM803_06535 [Rhodocyclaceae bacterium]
MKMPTLACRCLFAGVIATTAFHASATTDMPPAMSEQLASKIELAQVQTLVDSLIADQRGMLAHNMLAGIGARGQLGKDWHPGNPYYDREYALVCAALDDEESRSGKLLGITPQNVRDALTAQAGSDEILRNATPEDLQAYALIAEYALVARVYQDMTGRSPNAPEVAARLDNVFASLRPDAPAPSQVMATLAERDPASATELRDITARLSRSATDSMLRSLSQRLTITFYRINGDLSAITAAYREQAGLSR